MTESPHGTGPPPVRRHARSGSPDDQVLLRGPSPATLASVALGIVIVVLVGTLSFFAMPRRPDLPPPVGSEAILASPAYASPTAEVAAESYSPAPVSLSARAAPRTRPPAPPRRTTPAARPSPKPTASRTKRPEPRTDELSPLPASWEWRLRSNGGGPSTFIEFVNVRTRPVVVYWLDYHGRRQRYAVLQAGRSHRQQTYVGHPWVVTDERGRALVCFQPEPRTMRAVIR
ncbi:hypothetical protein [Micromonospora sp. WMMD998]|uniref:VHL beta domain-containing protein n=1 Tax=Micromonospora sp. WMMD998 TaxID=3016092 RepID=UPI002499B452|nr:hypothetical protein [Micromonospora sp. WMMD998]WFE37994.1 hypothetical protein O7619_05925 [Micromonospora sp. WMMD998]